MNLWHRIRENCPQLEPQVRSLYLRITGDHPRQCLGAESFWEQERWGYRPAGWHLKSRGKVSFEMSLITGSLGLVGDG